MPILGGAFSTPLRRLRPDEPTAGGLVGPKTLLGQQPLPGMPAVAPPAPTGVTVPPPGGLVTQPTTPGGGIPLGDIGTGPILQIPEQGGPTQEYGPGNDLRSTQINPYTGQRLSGIQSGTDVLFKSLTGAPDLTQAALSKFDLLGQQSAEQRQLGIRNIGQAAARLGRLGSGMVTTDLGNLEDVLRTREEQARQGLAADTAYQESADRRANLGAAQGLENQSYNQGVGARNEVRTERSFQEDQARRAQDTDILRRQLQAQYDQYLRSLGLQGADIYNQQAGASSGAAAKLLSGGL